MVERCGLRIESFRLWMIGPIVSDLPYRLFAIYACVRWISARYEHDGSVVCLRKRDVVTALLVKWFISRSGVAHSSCSQAQSD